MSVSAIVDEIVMLKIERARLNTMLQMILESCERGACQCEEKASLCLMCTVKGLAKLGLEP